MIKLVLDSSADLTAMEGIPFSFAPLKIVTQEEQFIDDADLDVEAMAEHLYNYRGRSTTSCPNPEDWLAAFGDGEEILCITITSGISGTYNSARIAKQQYEEAFPHRKVELVDSLSAGPEIALMAEKAREWILEGRTLEQIASALKSYRTELLFALESLQNFANNGRVSKLAAKTAGVLGIRAVGRASDHGTLELLEKVRGESRTLSTLIKLLGEKGYRGGKARITHCGNPSAAEQLAMLIKEHFKGAAVTVSDCRGLCAYYAERGGMLLGFEA
jgi:DegV family protein with EDD domain